MASSSPGPAGSEPGPGGERRRHPRFTLRIFGSYNTCTVALDMVRMVDCSLVDVSRGGVRVRLNPIRKNLPEVVPGQRIEFREFLSDRFKGLSGQSGRVTWFDPSAQEFGVSFEEPVAEDVVAGLLE